MDGMAKMAEEHRTLTGALDNLRGSLSRVREVRAAAERLSSRITLRGEEVAQAKDTAMDKPTRDSLVDHFYNVFEETNSECDLAMKELYEAMEMIGG